MKKIPITNYFLSLIIGLITVVLVFYIMDRYNNRLTEINFINEVKEADLDYYIAENNNVLIYMTSGKNSRTIDKEFKKYLKNRDIKEKIIYVNLNDVSATFKDKFGKKYVPLSASYKLYINDPTMIFIENGQIEYWLTDIKEFEQIKLFIERSNIK